jgi:AcrR family transcriptional regulator
LSEQPQVPERPRRQRGRPRLTEPTAEYLQRRDEIIETAARVFHARGYDSGSLDDVAAELDLRKASLYYYVASKAQLLYLVFDRAISLALKRLDDLSRIEDPAERLAAFVVHQVCIVAEERSLFSVFFESRPRLDADYEEQIRSKEKQYLRLYVDAVARAVEAGVLPKIDPRFGAQAILGMSSWVYKWFDPTEDDAKELAGDFVELVLKVRLPVETLSAVELLQGQAAPRA